MKPGLFAAVVIAVFLLGFAVGRTSAPAAPEAAAGGMAAAGTGALPANHPPTGAAAPQGMGMGMGAQDPNAAPPAGQGVTGAIAELIQVPNYTYVRLTTAAGEEWAAVSTNTGLAQGQTVTVVGTPMAGFTSSTLKRTFDRIWFGNLVGAGAPTGGGAMQGGAMPAPQGMGMGGAAGAAVAAVQKADGPLGLRVADVYSERKALVGKTVRVRGTVTKVSSIQGVNYVHLKDGSGSAATADDDLTVLTSEAVTPNEVATLEGVVAVDKDLGMGARPLVLENAKVVGK